MGKGYFYYLLKLVRPRQWIKNFALFAAAIFGGQMFLPDVMWRVSLGFIAFCLLASSTYIVNDLLDVQKDRLHPFKKARPIASGKITANQAIILFLILIIISLSLSWQISVFFFLIAVFYLVLQFSYSLLFKSLVVFDI